MTRRHTWAYGLGATAIAEVERAARSPFGEGARVPGTRLRIRRHLATGARGIVYEAEHLHLERPVALKILRPDLAAIGAEGEHLRRQACSATRVDSPHVVVVHDFGFLDDGRAYSVMELLTGHSIADEIACGPVPVARVVDLLRQMRAGMDAADRAGVDCQLAPDDVFVVKDEAGGERIKLLGLARGDGCPSRPRALASMALALVGQPRLAACPALERVIQRCVAFEPGVQYRDMAEPDAVLREAQVADGIASERNAAPPPSPIRWWPIARIAAPLTLLIAVGAMWVDAPTLPPTATLVEPPTNEPAVVLRGEPTPPEPAPPEPSPPEPPLLEPVETALAPPPPPPPRADPVRTPRPDTDRKAAQEAVKRGKQALAAGDRAVAAAMFRAALEHDPKSASALAGASDIAFDEGDYARALGLARRAVRIQPKNADHFIRVGDASYKLRDYANASASYREAAKLGHRDADARLRRIAGSGTM